MLIDNTASVKRRLMRVRAMTFRDFFHRVGCLIRSQPSRAIRKDAAFGRNSKRLKPDVTVSRVAQRISARSTSLPSPPASRLGYSLSHRVSAAVACDKHESSRSFQAVLGGFQIGLLTLLCPYACWSQPLLRCRRRHESPAVLGVYTMSSPVDQNCIFSSPRISTCSQHGLHNLPRRTLRKTKSAFA